MNMSGSSSTNSTTTSIATNAVTIRNFVFSPASITIKKDTKVLWTNQDSVAHTVTETGSQAGPNSSALDPGTSYSFTFVQAGSYHYHCSIHPQMTGTVTVTD
jgi:plastocyanin